MAFTCLISNIMFWKHYSYDNQWMMKLKSEEFSLFFGDFMKNASGRHDLNLRHIFHFCFFVYRGCVPRFETRERVASGWRTRPADRFRFILLDYLQTSGAISVNPALPNIHFFSTFYLSGGSANHGLSFLCNGRQQAHETCLVIELMV